MVEVALFRKRVARATSDRTMRLGKSLRGRIFDIALSSLLLAALAPLMIATALAIYLEDGGLVLFAQSRLGFAGRSFRCFKFRSMCVDAEMRLGALLEASPAARAQWEQDHSGPLHLAAAMGLTCIAMFGDYNTPKKWHPVGDRHRIIHNMAGVMAITPDEVFTAAQAVLSRQPVENAAP